MEQFSISMNLFCSTLRHNPIWAPAVPRLLQWDGPSRWRETTLGTHDIALCPPGAFSGGNTHFFRLLLLCPDDITLPETSRRIQQLQEADKNAAIIFLIDEDVTKNATLAFTKLQIDIPYLPLIPLPAVLLLPETLQAFQNSLTHSRVNRYRPSPGDVASNLIPYCAVGGPLSDRTTEVLITSCHSIRGVVEALEEERSEGLLANALGGDEVEAGRVVSFWRHEFGL
ncbi:hypothetical protein QBC39DRAFT_368113 [Podospora conica]|nr:hypothetical protein QBC39DRAFT_368113 [Schizothecium conicum]